MKLFDHLQEGYGEGIFRRHILIRFLSDTELYAALEDEPHAFSIKLTHDGLKVTSIEATWDRHPTSTCPGSIAKLQELVGYELTANPLDLRSYANAKSHCTHFYDLASVMISHTVRRLKGSLQGNQFLYTMSLTDEVAGKAQAELLLNGKLLQRWKLINSVIEAPSHLKGKAPLRGLTSWARDNLSASEIEEIILLQKAIFVAQGRRFDLNALKGILCKDIGQPVGQCYALNEGREEEAIRIGLRKDFTNAMDDLLHFAEEPSES